MDRRAPRVLPLAAVGGHERRACAVFADGEGGVVALQVTCALGEEPSVTAFVARRAADGGWGRATAIAVDQPVPAAPSLRVAPVPLQGEGGLVVAWPLDDGGHLVLEPQGASVADGPDGGRVTALCAAGGDLVVASLRDGAAEAGLFAWRDRGWQAAGAVPCAAGEAVTALAAFDGHLHAAASDARAGFALWRAPVGGGAWTPVIERGGWRYGQSPAVSAMAVVGDRLLVAADGADTGHVRVGDEHPEIVAVAPGGRWRLVSGQARFSPDGLLRPEAAGGPGTPAFAGLTIGGLQARGGDVTAWLRPRGGPGPVRTCRWSAGAWSEGATVPAAGGTVLTLAEGADGAAFAAAGGDMEAGDGPRRPLLVAST